MTEGTPKGPLAALHQALHAGEITRREFTLRALALGVGMPVISFVLRAEDVRASRATAHRLGCRRPGRQPGRRPRAWMAAPAVRAAS